MLFPEDIEIKIGFSKIRDLLVHYCLSDPGKEYVDKLAFSNDHTMIVKLLSQVSEFKSLLQQKEYFPGSNYFDIREHLNKSSIENSWLSESELFEISLFLKTVEESIEILVKKGEEFPALSKLTRFIEIDPQIRLEIETMIDEKGGIRSKATPEMIRILFSGCSTGSGTTSTNRNQKSEWLWIKYSGKLVIKV